jgi:Fe-S cluster assembly protein SufB
MAETEFPTSEEVVELRDRENISTIHEIVNKKYAYGWTTPIEEELFPFGLNEDIIRKISEKKEEQEWMTEWRLNAYRNWTNMQEPHWAHIKYKTPDFQSIRYYSAPKMKEKPKNINEVEPEILRTFEKLGIPLEEQKRLVGGAVDAVFDSVSVATTHQEILGRFGIIFCSMSEAIRNYPELVRQYLGSVVPPGDNFYAALNSAVFSDGSFVYVPKGVKCPMDLSTYFRINSAQTGQFERTLIIAEEGAEVSYLEGCTAPIRDENQLHAAVVELVAHKNATIRYSTVQNWYAGDEEGRGGIFNFVTKRGNVLAIILISHGHRWKQVLLSHGSIRVAFCKGIILSANFILWH